MAGAVKIGIILGSTRNGRVGERVAAWIHGQAHARGDLEAELLDLRDYPLGFYEHPAPPMKAELSYTRDVEKRWWERINDKDGFVIVSPEYNHGYPGVLKNALDFAYAPWNRKAVALVSYGGAAGGVRAAEQLRLVSIELQMAPIRDEVNIPLAFKAFDDRGEPVDGRLNARAATMFRELVWWARVLRDGRANPEYRPE
jgi:NAD(P)H-dependent FMN reductase